MAARGDLTAQFIEITGTDENVARFYLSSCDWDIEVNFLQWNYLTKNGLKLCFFLFVIVQHALGNYWSTQADFPGAPTVAGQPSNPTSAPVTTTTSASVGAGANFAAAAAPAANSATAASVASATAPPKAAVNKPK